MTSENPNSPNPTPGDEPAAAHPEWAGPDSAGFVPPAQDRFAPGFSAPGEYPHAPADLPPAGYAPSYAPPGQAPGGQPPYGGYPGSAPAGGYGQYPAGRGNERPPAETFDIVAFILSILAPVVGLILGLVSSARARRERRLMSGLGVASIWVGSILTALSTLLIGLGLLMTMVFGAAFLGFAASTADRVGDSSFGDYGDYQDLSDTEQRELYCGEAPALVGSFAELRALDATALEAALRAGDDEALTGPTDLLYEIADDAYSLSFSAPDDIVDSVDTLSYLTVVVADSLQHVDVFVPADLDEAVREADSIEAYTAATCG
ncbi:hypothetical protein [Mycetocola spongiae]|uniref:hypothetical protein n=1 Tax=Mycetocola spongiae TaxID=2859226 RepID=UPI001CF114D9|nr:hypothetical protein [Mycetocola spongiae]UCR88806.1 hypothetical protein KXZ72_12750 [Mycetocola spongiae]